MAREGARRGFRAAAPAPRSADEQARPSFVVRGNYAASAAVASQVVTSASAGTRPAHFTSPLTRTAGVKTTLWSAISFGSWISFSVASNPSICSACRTVLVVAWHFAQPGPNTSTVITTAPPPLARPPQMGRDPGPRQRGPDDPDDEDSGEQQGKDDAHEPPGLPQPAADLRAGLPPVRGAGDDGPGGG